MSEVRPILFLCSPPEYLCKSRLCDNKYAKPILRSLLTHDFKTVEFLGNKRSATRLKRSCAIPEASGRVLQRFGARAMNVKLSKRGETTFQIGRAEWIKAFVLLGSLLAGYAKWQNTKFNSLTDNLVTLNERMAVVEATMWSTTISRCSTISILPQARTLARSADAI